MEVVHRVKEVVTNLAYRRGSESSDDARSGGSQGVISGDARIRQSEIDNQNLEKFNTAEILTGSAGENVTADEEVIELEFERAIDKVHTYTPHCPNCNTEITKVILRRNIKPPRDDTFGCLSYLSIFKPSGDRWNTFKLFEPKPKEEIPKTEDVQPSHPGAITSVQHPLISLGATSANVGDQHLPISEGGTSANIRGTWLSLNPFNCFGSSSTTSNAAVATLMKPLLDEETFTINDVEPDSKWFEILKCIGYGGLIVSIKTLNGLHLRKPPTETTNSSCQRKPPIPHANQDSKWFEILKCIVYGGLIVSIASLSVVSSAAASDATTLNVVIIGLATLLSGLFAFGCNLGNLSGENYKEVLGQSEHFLFHSTFSILSYLIFGLVAPTTYALAFRESDNNDYKILAVAAAGFGCIFILAIAKSYVKGYKFGGYIKTILFYFTMAVSASAVAYATGDLIGKLLGDLGWFPLA